MNKEFSNGLFAFLLGIITLTIMVLTPVLLVYGAGRWYSYIGLVLALSITTCWPLWLPIIVYDRFKEK